MRRGWCACASRIAAALTGSFSAGAAAISFAWMAGAGLFVGVVLTLVVTRTKAWVSRRFGEETGSQILISLLIPFGAYLIAEHIHASGILAAVAAGVTMSFAEISREALAVTRMRRNSVWDTIQFAANGMIFVLLGEQLPEILSGLDQTVRLTGHANPWWLAVYVAAIMAGLAALRFGWVWVSFSITLLRRAPDREIGSSPPLRLVAAMSFAGVRGAITLAGVLTLPLALGNGTPFPGRELAIFLATGVILVSLVMASLVLPLVLRGLKMPAEPSQQAAEDMARVAAAEAAIKAVERVQHALAEGRNDADVYATAGARIMDGYRERIESRSSGREASQEARANERIERDLRLAAVRAERAEIVRILRDRQIGSELATKLVRELDLLEVRYR